MARKNHPNLTCEHCQQPFLARNAKPSYRPRFCSRQCHGKSKRAAVVEVQCVQCNRLFDRKAWHAAKTQGRGPFCGFPAMLSGKKRICGGRTIRFGRVNRAISVSVLSGIGIDGLLWSGIASALYAPQLRSWQSITKSLGHPVRLTLMQ